jgi:TolB-like protein/DNA-binding SARP family transcriptional activator
MIEFRMFGTLQLTDAAGHEVQSLITRPRRLALLAYLAASTGRNLHRRDTLLALFWPELDQEHARAALRQALHVLRNALGTSVIVSRGDDDIGLDAALLWSDVAVFDRAVAGEQWAAALELYRGALLEGFFISGAGEFERWLDDERSRRQRDATRCAQRLLERSEADGDLTAAAAWARRATQLAPHDEDAMRGLITVLDRLGDRAGAVQVFDDFAKRLAADLETEPAAETKALLTAVRARDAARPVELSTVLPRPRSRRRNWLAWAAAGALATIALGLLWPRSTMPAIRSIRSLAVLPIENFSGDSLQSWFADGMTEALITDLGRISALRVPSLGAVEEVKRTGVAPREIGNALQVAAYLESGVQRSGDRVRVDLRLVDAASGYQLWAGRIEEPLANRFAIEDSVTRGVVAALHVPLTSAEERFLDSSPTTNPEAYDLYLRGRIRIRHETRADDSAAISYFEQAVAIDSRFALAYAHLARAYGLRASQLAREDTTALVKAYVAVDKALELSPELADAHWARAFLLWGTTGQFRHEEAIREDRRAVALNPNLGDAHHHLGMIYLHIGLLEQAINEFRVALSLNPFDANPLRRIGIAEIYRGQYEQGLTTIRDAGPESNPALWSYQVAWALLYLGRDKEASTFMENYLQSHPEDRGGVVRSTRAILRAKLGDARGAGADIRQAIISGRGFIHFHHTAYNIASAYALLGRPRQAVAWLRRAADEGWPCYPYFRNDPNLAAIKQDAGFITFMSALKTRWERYRAMLHA